MGEGIGGSKREATRDRDCAAQPAGQSTAQARCCPASRPGPARTCAPRPPGGRSWRSGPRAPPPPPRPAQPPPPRARRGACRANAGACGVCMIRAAAAWALAIAALQLHPSAAAAAGVHPPGSPCRRLDGVQLRDEPGPGGGVARDCRQQGAQGVGQEGMRLAIEAQLARQQHSAACAGARHDAAAITPPPHLTLDPPAVQPRRAGWSGACAASRP